MGPDPFIVSHQPSFQNQPSFNNLPGSQWPLNDILTLDNYEDSAIETVGQPVNSFYPPNNFTSPNDAQFEPSASYPPTVNPASERVGDWDPNYIPVSVSFGEPPGLLPASEDELFNSFVDEQSYLQDSLTGDEQPNGGRYLDSEGGEFAGMAQALQNFNNTTQ